MVWTSADAIMVVIQGTVLYSLEGGVPGSESKSVFANETIGPGDVAYIPNGRAYWFQEATGAQPAMTITVFNVGNWKSFEMQRSLAAMNQVVVASNLHLTEVNKFERTIDLTGDCERGGMLRDGKVTLSMFSEKGFRTFRTWSVSTPVLMLLVALAMWALVLTGAVVFLLRKVQSQSCQTMASPLLARC